MAIFWKNKSNIYFNILLTFEIHKKVKNSRI